MLNSLNYLRISVHYLSYYTTNIKLFEELYIYIYIYIVKIFTIINKITEL